MAIERYRSARLYMSTAKLLYHAAHLEYFFSILLPGNPQDTFLDPKFDEEHDARISFGHRPPAACARAGQSQPI